MSFNLNNGISSFHASKIFFSTGVSVSMFESSFGILRAASQREPAAPGIINHDQSFPRIPPVYRACAAPLLSVAGPASGKVHFNGDFLQGPAPVEACAKRRCRSVSAFMQSALLARSRPSSFV